MKYVLTALVIIAGAAIGLFIGMGIFEGYGWVLALFVLFPAAALLSMAVRAKKLNKEIDPDLQRPDRFYRHG